MDQDERHRNHLYISPHLDDVIWSCGGSIAQHCIYEEMSFVITLFAGTPYNEMPGKVAKYLHRIWQSGNSIADVIEARRNEDLKACEVLGVKPYCYDLVDALYRLDNEEHSLNSLHRDLSRNELDLVDQVMDILQDLSLTYAPARFYIPLGVGNHIDHVITCVAALELSSCLDIDFYEDFPYVLDEEALLKRITSMERHFCIKPVLKNITDYFSLKVSAGIKYESQIRDLFDDISHFSLALHSYSRSYSSDDKLVERYWRIDHFRDI